MNDLRISMWGDDSFRYWYAHHHIISYTFFSNLFYCSIQYVQTVCASCFFISLDVFSACEADTDVYDGEDMIVLGTSGGGDDLVCNVVIFLGRVDFFRACRGFDVQFVGIYTIPTCFVKVKMRFGVKTTAYALFLIAAVCRFRVTKKRRIATTLLSCSEAGARELYSIICCTFSFY